MITNRIIDGEDGYSAELRDIMMETEREKLMKLRAERQIKEYELDQLTGDLVESAGVKKGIAELLAKIKVNMLKVPAEFMRMYPDAEKDMIDGLNMLINKTLSDLSEKL